MHQRLPEWGLEHERKKLNQWVAEWQKKKQKNRLAYLRDKRPDEVLHDLSILLRIENVMHSGDFKKLHSEKQLMIANIWLTWDREIRPLIANNTNRAWGMRLEDARELIKKD